MKSPAIIWLHYEIKLSPKSGHMKTTCSLDDTAELAMYAGSVRPTSVGEGKFILTSANTYYSALVGTHHI